MATNYVQDGRVIDWANSTGDAVSSGDLVIFEDTAGVALVDIANGATGAVQIEGVFTIADDAKEETFAVGDNLYWDADGDPYGGTSGTGCVTKVSTSNVYIGKAMAAKVAAAAGFTMKLN